MLDLNHNEVFIPENSDTEGLNKIYCVAKDSPVTIFAQHGQLKIQVQGVARENGELGQLIRIKNISSKKVIIGQVIGQKKVQIHF